MTIDGYLAADIDRCQYALHTGQVTDTPVMVAPAGPSSAAAVCCTPLLREPITADQAAELARLLKALADPTRLRLVSMVAAHEGGEACVCELTEPLGLTQPTISHHLKILVDAGIFTRDKRGVWAYYALVPAAMNALSAMLSTTGSHAQHPR
jgi:ArsR family transcriptional regulator, arsenate/arsenite/antimonite-responsive transcriptional repressor